MNEAPSSPQPSAPIPPQYPVPNQFPQPPISSSIPPHKSHVAMIVTIFLIIFVGLPLAFGAYVLTNRAQFKDFFGAFSTTSQSSTAISDYTSADQINAKLASNEYFNLKAPALTCGPADSLYASNQQEWAKGWITCLEQTWKPVVDGSTYKDTGGATKHNSYYSIQAIYFVDTFAEGIEKTGCSSSTASSATNNTAIAAYCRSSSTIFVLSKTSGYTLDENLATIFHEYTHHLQLNFGISLDSDALMRFMYQDYPKQPIALEAALTLQHNRRETNAECSSLIMMQQANRLTTSDGTTWLSYYTAPTQEMIQGGYGTVAQRKEFVSTIKGSASPSMQTCNTWKLADSEIQ